MAVSVPRDPGIARCAVELRELWALREPPRERMLAPAGPDEEHFHPASLTRRRNAQDGVMQEPGLDFHIWAARWEQLLDAVEESPADAVSEMGRLLEEMLGTRDPAEAENEPRKQFDAARELEEQYGRDGDPGDLAEAINGYIALYELLMPDELEADEPAPGRGRRA